MTVPLKPGSPRGMAAKRFGAELRRAMLERKVGALRLAEAAGVAKSAIANWKAGGNLPRLDTAARLAEVLDWPKLVEISRAGRSSACQRCGREYVANGGNVSRFCSVDCREIDAQLRRPQSGTALAQSLRDVLASRQGVKGGIPKLDIELALIRYNRGEARRVLRQDRLAQEAAALRAAIADMCRGCEPAGLCRTPECALRPASPLLLQVTEARGEVRPVAAWTPERRERLAAGTRARWARPGERERQADETRARWAAMTDDERAAAGRLISERRKAVPA